ncbi:MAG: hypothetical protein KGL52_00170 [Rhodospirillales bacterium]|jgi:hypothetical protein|nr:hypothetical protein [Rhodospirillales bacterium]
MPPRFVRPVAALAFGLALALTAAPGIAHAERHPVIRTALHRVNGAIAVLRHGAHDFHGHREAAMRALAAARQELIAALRSDR